MWQLISVNSIASIVTITLVCRPLAGSSWFSSYLCCLFPIHCFYLVGTRYPIYKDTIIAPLDCLQTELPHRVFCRQNQFHLSTQAILIKYDVVEANLSVKKDIQCDAWSKSSNPYFRSSWEICQQSSRAKMTSVETLAKYCIWRRMRLMSACIILISMDAEMIGTQLLLYFLWCNCSRPTFSAIVERAIACFALSRSIAPSKACLRTVCRRWI